MATIVMVADQLPGRQIAFEKSGHGYGTSKYLEHFAARGDRVVLVALRPSFDFLAHRVDDPLFELRSPVLRKFGSWYLAVSLTSIARTLAWKAYLAFPQSGKNIVSSVRSFLRSRRGFHHVLGTFPNEREIRFARTVIEREKPDFVIFDSLFSFCGISEGPSHWVITHDLKYERAESFRQRGYAVLPREFDRERERSILSQIANVIAVQWDEAAQLRMLCPNANVIVVPVAIEAIAPKATATRAGGRCVFVGSGSLHNVDGLRWFLDAVWPLIRREMPAAHLDIYGSVCFRIGGLPENVQTHGVVPSLDEAYETAGAVVVPLLMGSGLKVKLMEALSYASPVVTTSIGAQGLLGIAPRPFLLADSADGFAKETVRLLESSPLRRKVAAAAAQCAQRFSPTHAFAELDESMNAQLSHTTNLRKVTA